MVGIAVLFEDEDCLGPIFDYGVGDWTGANMWYTDMNDSHRFRIRKGPTQKIMLEMRGSDFGTALTATLARWEEMNGKESI